ncbi:hypothetical protein EC917_101323 [Bacillus thuringiensis]|uniref:Uncharacterized protein n=1 Tax=Bacillus thuringiensis TaxID=1428 RepID=A0A4R4BKN0_BACTU|nr:hypothetical protein [Bacillus thuringiensis]TCW59069.1 hypothetical protein EC917_101323 [Bacillus thuringiensis]TCW59691.1 hypothetical protein EC910_101321 [Bacillus thuringiensis]
MIKFNGQDVQVNKEKQKEEGIKRIEISLTEEGAVRTLSIERYAFALSGNKNRKKEENLIYENSFGNYLNIEGAVEHFYDSFPEEWGQMIDDYDGETSYLDKSHESIIVMENGLKLKIEISFDDDAEDKEDESWVCKAYKIS